MRTILHPGSRLALCLILFVVAAIAISPLAAQTSNRTPTTDRLFIGFAKDASLADHQWWEGQQEISSHDVMDTVAAKLVFAVRPIDRFDSCLLEEALHRSRSTDGHAGGSSRCDASFG